MDTRLRPLRRTLHFHGNARFSRALVSLALVGLAFVLPTPEARAHPANAIISNGTVQLGVWDEGHLNVPGGVPSSGSGTTFVGLRYLPTGAEATAPGCLCEGWGAADATSGTSGYANEAIDGVVNMTPVSFTSSASTAVAVVNIGSTLRVTHDYHPSTATPNLYEALVTIENISGAPVDAHYRRVMDWDVEPTFFDEFVTIQGGGATALLFDSNNGFASANPLAGPSDLGATGNFTDVGPTDHGALFDFGFGTIASGASKTFKIFYGAAGTEADALAALGAVGAEVYSLGQPNTPGGPSLGTPNTFVFAFAGVGGTPISTADLSVAKSDSPDPVTEGETLTYSLTITNGGPDPATDVNLTDTLPAGVTFDSATPSQGTCGEAGGAVTCTLGSLAAGATASVATTVTPTAVGTITNTATVSANQSDPNSTDNTASVETTVEPANQPPECSGVAPSLAQLWPPNHKLHLPTLSGASDPDGDPVTITIAGVTQDEPVSGLGSGDTSPDAVLGPASNEVSLRAERSGTGDGRVYRISFTATDPSGASCSGTVTVGVPHDQSGDPPVDSAPPSYDSLLP